MLDGEQVGHLAGGGVAVRVGFGVDVSVELAVDENSEGCASKAGGVLVGERLAHGLLLGGLRQGIDQPAHTSYMACHQSQYASCLACDWLAGTPSAATACRCAHPKTSA